MNEKSKYTELLENLQKVMDEYRAGADIYVSIGMISGLLKQAKKDGLTKD